MEIDTGSSVTLSNSSDFERMGGGNLKVIREMKSSAMEKTT
jgi:hypothetical protein